MLKHLDRIANLAIIVAVVVLIFVEVKQASRVSSHQISANTAPPQSSIMAGETLSVPGVTWPKGSLSVVLVMSTECHYCKESLPFYRELVARVGDEYPVIAILPQPVSNAQRFLEDAGVKPSKIVEASLTSLGIRGTPTLLLVGSDGRIKRVWIGKLDSARQEEVIKAIAPKV
jgi:thiol-disulfide isomerase/thioredoxin